MERAKAYTRPAQGDLISRAFHLLRVRNKRRKAIEEYLVELLRRFSHRSVAEINRFLEIGVDSFQQVGTEKGKEGFVKKRRKLLGNLCAMFPKI